MCPGSCFDHGDQFGGSRSRNGHGESKVHEHLLCTCTTSRTGRLCHIHTHGWKHGIAVLFDSGNEDLKGFSKCNRRITTRCWIVVLNLPRMSVLPSLDHCAFCHSLKRRHVVLKSPLHSFKCSISSFIKLRTSCICQQMLFTPLLSLSHTHLPTATLIVQCLANWSADVIALLCSHAKLHPPNWQIMKQLGVCGSVFQCVWLCVCVGVYVFD